MIKMPVQKRKTKILKGVVHGILKKQMQRLIIYNIKHKENRGKDAWDVILPLLVLPKIIKTRLVFLRNACIYTQVSWKVYPF